MVKITRGKDASFLIKVRQKQKDGSPGDPFDLSELVSARLRLHRDEDEILELTLGDGLTVEGNPEAGNIRVDIETADTDDLAETENEELELEYEVGVAAADDPANFKDTIYIPGALTVRSSGFEE